MQTVLLIGLWLATLAVALYAAEKLVVSITSIGREVGLTSGHLGLLVAAGADAPEVTSALIALSRGAQGIGLGVVAGSNIYNLAGLLGLSALLAGGITCDRFRLALDGGGNLALTIALLVLLEFPAYHLPLSLVLLLLLGLYVVGLSIPRQNLAPRLGIQQPAPPAEGADEPLLPFRRSLIVASLSIVAIAGGSDVLVQSTIQLGHRLHLPPALLSDIILPVATSLPNTWAAVSLARKGLARAAISATFNSNSINIGIGTGIPGLFVAFHVSQVARTFVGGWLLGMTLVAIILLATRLRLQRWEGTILLGLYAGFVVLRLAVF